MTHPVSNEELACTLDALTERLADIYNMVAELRELVTKPKAVVFTMTLGSPEPEVAPLSIEGDEI